MNKEEAEWGVGDGPMPSDTSDSTSEGAWDPETSAQVEAARHILWIAVEKSRSREPRLHKSVFTHQKRIVPGQVWMMSNFREHQILLHVVADLFPS